MILDEFLHILAQDYDALMPKPVDEDAYQIEISWVDKTWLFPELKNLRYRVIGYKYNMHPLLTEEAQVFLQFIADKINSLLIKLNWFSCISCEDRNEIYNIILDFLGEL